VSIPRFFNFFLNFLIKIKKIATCQAVIVPRDSDVAVTVTRVSITPGVIFLVSIWSLYFNLSQFSPNFCKS